jgi:hypothetical protein
MEGAMRNLRCRLFGHVWPTEPVLEAGMFFEELYSDPTDEQKERMRTARSGPCITAFWTCRRCGRQRHFTNYTNGDPTSHSPGVPSL